MFKGVGEAAAVAGDALALKLKIRLGQKMVVSVNDVHGQMSSILVRLCGTFHTGVEEMDSTGLLLPLATARA